MTFSNVLGVLPDKMSTTLEDASDLTWAHAVNSLAALEEALSSSVDFMEADVLLGHLVGRGDAVIPIMAHPPNKSSDLSLENLLSIMKERSVQKGLKLDFKSLEVLEPSMQILQNYASELNSSVWLNADVLRGPVKSPINPVPVEQFLSLCHHYFPNATLSIGWTTLWLPSFDQESWHYNWQHVREMADVIRCRGYGDNYPQFTFPVRAIFASRSTKQLQWLLSVIPHSTLTVWSGRYDPLEVHDLYRIRASFPKDLVYYDVPEPTSTTFSSRKNSIEIHNHMMPDDKQWMTITHGQRDDCSFHTYVKNDVIFFGRSLTTVVLRKNLFSLKEEPNLKVTGWIQFLGTNDHSSRSQDAYHELKLVAVDVSLFSKNMSHATKNQIDLSTSDTDVILSAVNSSIIYTFQNLYSESENYCHSFKIDASADKSFEAWTVSCQNTLEEKSSEELIKSGIPEISSRNRLVLPNEPFMFGFVSNGDGYVVIYDLKISGQNKSLTSGSELTKSTYMGLSILSILYMFFLYI